MIIARSRTQDVLSKSNPRHRKIVLRLSSTKCWLKQKWKTRNEIKVKALDFTKLCLKHHPGSKWHEFSHRQQVDVLREELRRKHFLLEPHSDYMKFWDIVQIVSLAIIAIVTPFEVCFGNAGLNLYVLNRLLDVIFIKDMIMQFFLKVEVKREDINGTVLLRNPELIRRHYLRSRFALDLVSIFLIDFVLSHADQEMVDGQQINVINLLRVLRLVTLFRIVRSSRVFQRWQNYLYLSFAKPKLVRFVGIPLLSSHWLGCAWGMAGRTFGM